MVELKISGKEKALIFLSTLGDEVSAKVLNCLPDKLSSRITEELANFTEPTPAAVAFVFKALNKFALTSAPKPKLMGAVESQVSTEQLDSLSQLGRKTPQQLMSILQNEQPQTTAYIMSYLSSSLRERFYQLLSPGKRSEIKKINVEKIPLSDKVFEKINEHLLANEMA